jgi:hypothetical protein
VLGLLAAGPHRLPDLDGMRRSASSSGRGPYDRADGETWLADQRGGALTVRAEPSGPPLRDGWISCRGRRRAAARRESAFSAGPVAQRTAVLTDPSAGAEQSIRRKLVL